jgi:hypothetical protein
VELSLSCKEVLPGDHSYENGDYLCFHQEGLIWWNSRLRIACLFMISEAGFLLHLTFGKCNRWPRCSSYQHDKNGLGNDGYVLHLQTANLERRIHNCHRESFSTHTYYHVRECDIDRVWIGEWIYSPLTRLGTTSTDLHILQITAH